jgi:hypothetical protein
MPYIDYIGGNRGRWCLSRVIREWSTLSELPLTIGESEFRTAETDNLCRSSPAHHWSLRLPYRPDG